MSSWKELLTSWLGPIFSTQDLDEENLTDNLGA